MKRSLVNALRQIRRCVVVYDLEDRSDGYRMFPFGVLYTLCPLHRRWATSGGGSVCASLTMHRISCAPGAVVPSESDMMRFPNRPSRHTYPSIVGLNEIFSANLSPQIHSNSFCNSKRKLRASRRQTLTERIRKANFMRA